MRRPVTILVALVAAFALVAFSRAVLLTSASWPASRAGLRTAEDGSYTASADHTLAVPAIDLGDGWQTTLQIQNTGIVPTSARIEFYDTADAECPAIRQPFAVRCAGPIPAGAVHTFDVGGDPELAEARSAIVHSARPGDAGCSAAPGEPLAVVVRRTWVSNGGESRIASSAYVGIAPAVAGFWDADQKAYITVIPWVEVSGTNRTTLYLQNIGLECTDEIEAEFIPGPGGCGVPRLKLLPTIPPGHALRVNLAETFEDNFSGSAWIRSPQPLAVVVDRQLSDGTLLSTHATGRGASHPTVDAPLVFHSSDGWNTALRDQNSSARVSAFLEMVYRTSDITPTLWTQGPIGPVCPGGSISVDTTSVSQLTSPFTATVALRSLSLDPDLPEVPRIASEVDLIQAGGGAAYRAPNRITGTLSAPDIALPWLTRAYRPLTTSLSLTYTSQIAVVNQSEAGEGFISLTFYDPDGSITTFQPETPLGPRAMRLIDLADIAALPAGWHGSAVLQFLSLDPGAGVAAAVLETVAEAPGDAMTSYAGIVTRVQAQPTPTPSPTATVTPTPTVTPQPSPTPATAQPTPLPNTYLPLLRQ